MTPTNDDLRNSCQESATRAGDVAISWQNQFSISTKAHAMDMVTEADREAETVVVDFLRAQHPDDAIRGEEGTAINGSSGRCWWIDPVDGTSNYIKGLPLWGTSIGVEDMTGPLAGAIAIPRVGEVWAGSVGQGLFRNGEVWQRPDGAQTLKTATMLHLWGWDPRDNGGDWIGRLQTTLQQSVGRMQAYYATAPMLAWVAAGHADIYLADTGIGLKPWDIVAGLALCRSAGLVSRQLTLDTGRTQIILTTPVLMEQLEQVLHSAYPRVAPVKTPYPSRFYAPLYPLTSWLGQVEAALTVIGSQRLPALQRSRLTAEQQQQLMQLTGLYSKVLQEELVLLRTFNDSQQLPNRDINQLQQQVANDINQLTAGLALLETTV